LREQNKKTGVKKRNPIKEYISLRQRVVFRKRVGTKKPKGKENAQEHKKLDSNKETRAEGGLSSHQETAVPRGEGIKGRNRDLPSQKNVSSRGKRRPLLQFGGSKKGNKNGKEKHANISPC